MGERRWRRNRIWVTRTASTGGGAPSTANDLFVASSGSNSTGLGTLANPWQTIAFGLSSTQLSAGKTLYIRGPGTGSTYAEQLAIFGWAGGTQGSTWSDAITISAYNGESVTVKPNAGSDFALVMRGSGAGSTNAPRWQIWRGIIFDGRNVNHDVVKITAYDASTTSQFFPRADAPSHHIRFSSCRITSQRGLGHTQQAILTTWDSDGVELIGCELDNVGDSTAVPNSQAIYGAAHDMVVQDCYIHDVSGYGISNLNSYNGLNVDNHQIIGNRISSCGAGINIGEGNGHKIARNRVWDNNSSITSPGGNGRGIFIGNESSTGTVVYFNTVSGHIREGIVVDSAQVGTIVRNNISHGNGTNYSDAGIGTVQSNNHFSATNPQFVDSASGNFHLTSSSPASILNAGVAVTGETVDADGVTRGNPPDVGAYELV